MPSKGSSSPRGQTTSLVSPTLAGELFPTEPPEHREPPPGHLKSAPCGVFAFPLHKATPHRSPRHLLKTEIGLYSSFAFPAQEQNLEIFPVTCPAQGAAPGHRSDCPALSLALTRLQGWARFSLGPSVMPPKGCLPCVPADRAPHGVSLPPCYCFPFVRVRLHTKGSHLSD